MAQKKNLSKKIRFEVFKRDDFTCQYCGKKAPEYVRQSYYLRGILRHKLAYVNDHKAIELLQTNLNFWEYEDIKGLCLTAKNWSEFQEESEKWIEEAADNVKNGKKDS